MNNDMQGRENLTKGWIGKVLSDAVILAAVSALGYSVAFAFEAGYAKHFGYPVYLISPTPSVILIALAVVIGGIFGLIPVFSDIFDNSPNEFNKKFSYVVFFMLLIGSVAVHLFALMNFDYSKAWIIGLVLVAFVAIIYLDRLIFKRDAVDKAGGLSRTVRNRLGLLVMIFCFGVYSLFSVVGILTAKNQKIFYFLKWKPDYAVVRLYDSVAIAVRYDFKMKKFTQDYYAVKVGDEKRELELMRVVINDKRLPVFFDED